MLLMLLLPYHNTHIKKKKKIKKENLKKSRNSAPFLHTEQLYISLPTQHCLHPLHPQMFSIEGTSFEFLDAPSASAWLAESSAAAAQLPSVPPPPPAPGRRALSEPPPDLLAVTVISESIQCALCGRFRRIPARFWRPGFGIDHENNNQWHCGNASWIPNAGCAEFVEDGNDAESADSIMERWSGLPVFYLCSPERLEFYGKLVRFLETAGIEREQFPHIGGIPIDFYRLYNSTIQVGGFQNAVENLNWRKVSRNAFDNDDLVGENYLATALRRNYVNYLLPFEDLFFHPESMPFAFETPRASSTASRKRKSSISAYASDSSSIFTPGQPKRRRGRPRKFPRPEELEEMDEIPPEYLGLDGNFYENEDENLELNILMAEIRSAKIAIVELNNRVLELEEMLDSQLDKCSKRVLRAILRLSSQVKTLRSRVKRELFALENSFLSTLVG